MRSAIKQKLALQYLLCNINQTNAKKKKIYLQNCTLNIGRYSLPVPATGCQQKCVKVKPHKYKGFSKRKIVSSLSITNLIFSAVCLLCVHTQAMSRASHKFSHFIVHVMYYLYDTGDTV